MRFGVRVMPKQEVLDSQGRTVQRTLQHNGLDVESCRVGKYIVLDINESSKEKALAKAHEIAEFVLYNPLIENYEIESL
jgi:phosphoribosylformylglycinamidine synthase